MPAGARRGSVSGMDLTTAVERLFAPASAPGGRVGAEVELIAVSDTDQPQPADPRVLAAGFDDRFIAEARPSFEPGGQLELSPPPSQSAAALTAKLERLVRLASALTASRGARLEYVGTNPYHSTADVPLRTAQPRYLAMQRQFDRVGPDGRRMMRLTASLQITLDILPGRAGREQWLVANLAGPPLTAAFANSPWLDGQPADIPNTRTRIWQGVDLRRTGYDGRHLDQRDPVGAYAAFAAAATRLPIPDARHAPYHLSTLFPPVRPRGGYFEVRYLDAQPLERIGAAISTLAVLLYDERCRRDALELLLPRLDDQDRAWSEAAAGFSPEGADLLSILASARPLDPQLLASGGVS